MAVLPALRQACLCVSVNGAALNDVEKIERRLTTETHSKGGTVCVELLGCYLSGKGFHKRISYVYSPVIGIDDLENFNFSNITPKWDISYCTRVY